MKCKKTIVHSQHCSHYYAPEADDPGRGGTWGYCKKCGAPMWKPKDQRPRLDYC